MSEPFIGEIKVFPWNWAPKGWLVCDGSILPTGQFQTLFALLGNRFGGNGSSTFGLPDLRGRVPLHYDVQGRVGGAESVALTAAQIPHHTHQMMGAMQIGNQPGPATTNVLASGGGYNTTKIDTVLSSQTCSTFGMGAAHPNVQPSIVANYCISVTGLWPTHP